MVTSPEDYKPFTLDFGDRPDVAAVAARLRRAYARYLEFAALWRDYLNSKPHDLQIEAQPDGACRRVVHRRQPIPLDLSLALGEYLYELRAALDNCLYAVAVIDSGQSPPPRAGQLQWPICATHSNGTSSSTESRDSA